MKRLRVLHMDSGRDWRGGQRQVFLLAQGLRDRGHEPVIFAPPESALLKRTVSKGIEARPLMMRADWDVRAASVVRLHVRESKVDIIHAHDARSHAIARIALIGLAHPFLVVTRRVPFVPKAARIKYGNRVSRFIAVSNAVKRAMIEAGIDANRIVVVHSGVQPPPADLERRDWRAELGWPTDAVICGVVGAMTVEKGVDYLEGIGRSMSDSARACARFLLLGGPKRGELEIGGVATYSAGFIEDITSAIAGVDLLLHPSRSEGLGTSVIDAMSVGAPPIAFSVGGLSELIEHEKNGLLVPQGDVEEFARAAEVLIRDPDFRAYLGGNARERAREFSADAMTERTEAVYYHLISRSENESSSSILRSTSA